MKSAATPGETPVPATLQPPPGLRIRWLGTAGFEISDDDTSILIDPFMSRPGILDTFLLKPLAIDTEAVDRYVFDPMGPDGLRKLKLVLVSHTHHDHAEDVPYVLAKYPHAADRPLVVGDHNLTALLNAYDGRVKENPWLAGVENLSQSPKLIVDFDKKQKYDPPIDKPIGTPIGTFGNFTVTAFVSEHALYDYYPVKLEGEMHGKPPYNSLDFLAYLDSSLTFLVEYAGPHGSFRIFATDTARYLNPVRVSMEVAEHGPVDLLLEGIASRKHDNGIPDRIAGLQPRYFVPTHFDNFFKSMDQSWTFDWRILLPQDNSRLKDFIDEYCDSESPFCPKLRMMKTFYYYSLNGLVRP
jgi:L-ascorbate metabolism protein UlaG (beta-lactamase superfamily)